MGRGLDGLGVISREQKFKLSPVWNREEIVQIIGKGSKTFKPGCTTKRIWEVKVNKDQYSSPISIYPLYMAEALEMCKFWATAKADCIS